MNPGEGSLPPRLAPMLAGGSGMPRDPTPFVFEPKWDGVRAIVTAHGGTVTFTSRLGADVTAAYPELAGLGPAMGATAAVLDGEVVAFDAAGRPSFQRLQHRMHVRSPPPQLLAEVPVALVLFDVLWLDGTLLVDRTQLERRAVLESLHLEGPAWHTTPVLDVAPGEDLLAACQQVGLEGYMAKRRDAVYQVGRRSPAWVKVKCTRRREFVVGGWAGGRRSREGSIGSLALGCYDRPVGTGGAVGESAEAEAAPAEAAPAEAAPAEAAPAEAAPVPRLRYVGKAGSGLSGSLITTLQGLFARIARPDSPFSDPVERGIHFVEPLLVVEVAYSSVTDTGTLRQPSLQGLRTDIVAADVAVDDELATALAGR